MIYASMVLLVVWFFCTFPYESWAETYLSGHVGPSVVHKQNIKVKTLNQNGEAVRREVIATDFSPGFNVGLKATHYFSKYFGIESGFFYAENRTQADLSQTRFRDHSLTQKRHAFLFTLLARKHWGAQQKNWLHFGLGYGPLYTDYESVGKEWDYGGQMVLGWNRALNRRYVLFIESVYYWAPDVGHVREGGGERIKSSGDPRYNLAHKIFGPHYDTQIIALNLGIRFNLSR